ncbi:MAG: NmrA/HSCARG family protein [Anaerolineae bacterium]|nr:MAG: NmrA/HSCARG family protein [Anaerolineae bacterium]
MNNKTILITGATGQQGGAAAQHLLKDAWKVRALVRDPNKEKAQDLAKQGVELVQGDLYDRVSLDDALRGAYGAFSVQNYWLPDVGYEGEIKQGKLFAEAAKEAGVKHFVYSSVGAAHRGMGQKHFESKWIVERYLVEIGLPHTILRPVAFMDNLNWLRAEISNGTLKSFGTAPDKVTQLIAVDDIGAIAAIVFANREEYLSRTLEIAGDELSDVEKARVLSEVIGRPVELVQPQIPDGFTPDEEQLAGVRFFNGESYTADIAAVRKIHPGLQDLDSFLRESGWEDMPVLPMPESGPARGG